MHLREPHHLFLNTCILFMFNSGVYKEKNKPKPIETNPKTWCLSKYKLPWATAEPAVSCADWGALEDPWDVSRAHPSSRCPRGCWQMSVRCFTVSSAPCLHPVLAQKMIGNLLFSQLIFKISVELGWSWGAFSVINLNTTLPCNPQASKNIKPLPAVTN